MHLVTGGAGFIGSRVVRRLVERGDRVRVLDNLSTGTLDNLAGIQERIEFVSGDLRDAADVRRAVAGVSTIFHHAAEPSVPRSIADPETTYAINVAGMLKLMLAARDAGAARLVFASSSAVYGNDPDMPKQEAMLPSPISPYAASKLAGEGLCQVFTAAYGLESVALRYFNVYGPGQDPNAAYAAVIPKFLDAIRRGETPKIFGDGEQSRDFVFVEDVVDANLLAAESPAAPGKVFNIASGEAITVNDALALINRIQGGAVAADYQPERAGDVRHSLADITLARTVLGFEPSVSREEGLRKTIAGVAAG